MSEKGKKFFSATFPLIIAVVIIYSLRSTKEKTSIHAGSRCKNEKYMGVKNSNLAHEYSDDDVTFNQNMFVDLKNLA